jgi:hypothetical protein
MYRDVAAAYSWLQNVGDWLRLELRGFINRVLLRALYKVYVHFSETGAVPKY